MAKKASEKENSAEPIAPKAPQFDPATMEKLNANADAMERYDVISQDEIDVLLSTYELVNSSAPGQSSDKQRTVRMYDFSAPDKFSKDHIRMLNAVHVSFVDGLSMELSEVFRLPVTANLVNVEQITYKEYLASIPSKTLFAEITAEPLSRTILFEVNPSLVGAWIDCLCGGDPKVPAAPSELTAIDLTVAERVIRSCTNVYSEAWANIVRLSPQVVRVIDSEHYDDCLLPADAVLICTIEVGAGRAYGIITICIPAGDVESVLPALSLARAGMNQNRGPDKASALEVRKALSPVRVECRVILGTAPISVRDIVNLRLDDVIRTTRRTDEDLEVWVGSQQMFGCRPGVMSGNLAAVVSHILDEEAFAELKDALEPEAEPPAQAAA